MNGIVIRVLSLVAVYGLIIAYLTYHSPREQVIGYENRPVEIVAVSSDGTSWIDLRDIEEGKLYRRIGIASKGCTPDLSLLGRRAELPFVVVATLDSPFERRPLGQEIGLLLCSKPLNRD